MTSRIPISAAEHLTPDTCRAARAIAKLSIDELAVRASIGRATLQRFETGASIRPAMRLAIVAALAAAGVEIIPGGCRRVLRASARSRR